jgi:hypothetical protein
MLAHFSIITGQREAVIRVLRHGMTPLCGSKSNAHEFSVGGREPKEVLVESECDAVAVG